VDYRQACKDFYCWGNILRGASTKPTLHDGVRHVTYSGGWKKLERSIRFAVSVGEYLKGCCRVWIFGDGFRKDRCTISYWEGFSRWMELTAR
jgi:hypothetical protein